MRVRLEAGQARQRACLQHAAAPCDAGPVNQRSTSSRKRERGSCRIRARHVDDDRLRRATRRRCEGVLASRRRAVGRERQRRGVRDVARLDRRAAGQRMRERAAAAVDRSGGDAHERHVGVVPGGCDRPAEPGNRGRHGARSVCIVEVGGPMGGARVDVRERYRRPDARDGCQTLACGADDQVVVAGWNGVEHELPVLSGGVD